MFKYRVTLFFFIISKCLCQNEIILETEQGTLEGTEKYNRKGGVFYSFQSIPFAKPPVGELRFREPQPAENWNGILDATNDLPECHQGNHLGVTFGQEDCLYLNVYTPQAPAQNYDSYKDVMVFIHGGGFYENSGRQDLYSPEYLMTEDIVLVTINYRLGIFGSFNLDDTSLGYPGNLGLKDQTLAFKWVKQHIDRFGGNADSITIFGESAGAVSVHYHILSPLSAGTFHKAILQSGTAISPWVKGIKNNGILLAEVLEIPTEDTKDMLRELLLLSGDEIYRGHQILNSALQTPPTWATLSFPIVEEKVEGQNAFLTEDPLTVIQTGEYNKVPMIVGYNDAEGIAFHFMYSELFNLIPGDLEIEKDSEPANELLDEIRAFYFNGDEPTIADQLSLIEIYTDVWFSYPSHRMTMEHLRTSNTPIYFYRFSADTQLNVYKLRAAATSVLPGATHCDDLGYLFHTFYHDLIIPQITPDSVEDKAIDRIVTLWTNFAKYGNPTPDEFSEFKWIPVTMEAFNYVDFGSTQTVPGVNPDVDRIGFWSDVYDKYYTYVTLETRQGNMRGTIKYNRKSEAFYSFQSIPFAKPPVGELRFKDPQPAENWDGTLDATHDLPQCLQGGLEGEIIGQEDCLYLNVYTPQAPASDYDTYKDVMIFIHGGGFYQNSGGEDLHSPVYLMAEDIVLVTINYRLGIFGSFNLNDTSLAYPGNLGLKDQSLAFKWVQQNIDRFGGNANSITIFGESAGAVSVHYHILSPLSAGTFHRAILQSGIATAPWVKGIPNNGLLLAGSLDIPTEDYEEMMELLLDRTADEIFAGYQKLNEILQATPSWESVNFPIVEQVNDQNAFLTEDPSSVIESGNYNHVPMMIGYNDAEGILLYSTYTDLFNLIPDDLRIEKDSDIASELLQDIKDFYFNGAEPSSGDTSLINIFTDVWFSFPSHKMTVEHLKTSRNSIYFYRFSADTGLNVFKLINPLTALLPGAAHADDLAYLFESIYHNMIIPEIVPNGVEDKAIDRIVTLWANFAKHANPTPDNFIEFKWEPITNETFNYVDFGSTNTTPGVDPDAERIRFWYDIYEKYSSSKMNTSTSILIVFAIFTVILAQSVL